MLCTESLLETARGGVVGLFAVALPLLAATTT